MSGNNNLSEGLVSGGDSTSAASVQTNKGKEANKTARMIELFIMVQSICALIFMVIGVPLPVITRDKNANPKEYTMFDHHVYGGSTCDKLKSQYHTSAAFGIMAELLMIVWVVVASRLYSNKLVISLPSFADSCNLAAIDRFVAPVVLVLTNLFMLICWAHVAHLRTAKLCNEHDNMNRGYGAGFVLILLAWLQHLSICACFVAREFMFGQYRYSVFEASLVPEGVAQSVRRFLVPSDVYVADEDVKKNPTRGWEDYAEKFVFWAQGGITIMMIIALPEEVSAYDLGKNNRYGVSLFSEMGCDDAKHKVRWAAAFGYFSIIASTSNLFLIMREYFDGLVLLHNIVNPIVFVAQNIAMIVWWGIVAHMWNTKNCGSQKKSKDIKGAELGGGFILALLCWLVHLFIIGAFVARKYAGGKKPASSLAPIEGAGAPDGGYAPIGGGEYNPTPAPGSEEVTKPRAQSVHDA